MAAGSALSLERIVVRAGRIVVSLACADGLRMTTPGIAASARQARPNLARHACINEAGLTFGVVMDHTPLPHLFEHLVIDLLVERSGQPEEVFVGTSEWVDASAGTARVEVSFSDDLDALGAIKDAATLLDRIVAEGDPT